MGENRRRSPTSFPGPVQPGSTAGNGTEAAGWWRVVRITRFQQVIILLFALRNVHTNARRSHRGRSVTAFDVGKLSLAKGEKKRSRLPSVIIKAVILFVRIQTGKGWTTFGRI